MSVQATAPLVPLRSPTFPAPEQQKKQLPLPSATNDLAEAKTAPPTCVLLLFPLSLSAVTVDVVVAIVVVNVVALAGGGVVLLLLLQRLRLVERFVIVPAGSQQYCLSFCR